MGSVGEVGEYLEGLFSNGASLQITGTILAVP